MICLSVGHVNIQVTGHIPSTFERHVRSSVRQLASTSPLGNAYRLTAITAAADRHCHICTKSHVFTIRRLLKGELGLVVSRWRSFVDSSCAGRIFAAVCPHAVNPGDCS